MIPCPKCRTIGTLTSRVRFVRGTIAELLERFPERAVEIRATGKDPASSEVYAVGVPEIACEACGETFDGSQPPPTRGQKR